MKNKRYSFKKIGLNKKEKEPLKPLFEKQALITALSVLLVVVITLTGSLAIFTKTSEGNEYNVVQVGELELSYVDLNEEGNVLQLADSYPISDTTGEKATPYRFSVENTGTIIAKYTIKIIDDTDTINADGCGDNLIDDTYLRYKFDNQTSQNLKDKKDIINGGYVIHSGTLEANESNIHEIRIWINDNSPNSILGTHYHGKVVIEIEQDNATDPYERPYRITDQFVNKVDRATTIDFSQISSTTNGRGIYEYTEDGADIYYWRGKVDEVEGVANHVIFGGYCWEMVRTTKTGGIKMIYDGTPVEVNGVKTCPNTGTASQLTSRSAFNSRYDDNAYVGYMYGMTGITTDENRCVRLDSDGVAKNYPVAIAETSCTAVGGKWATTAYEATHANVVNSTIKTAVDTWFASSTLNTAENLGKIEDAVYCNDRSIDQTAGSANGYTGYTTLGYGKNKTVYNATARVGYNLTNPQPRLECTNVNDRFTVSKENGNGDLTYPVGLLTADEIALAGGVYNTTNSDYYLYTGDSYIALSPYLFTGNARVGYVYQNGFLYDNYVDNEYSIRPVIALTASITFANGGTGTATNPYVVE